MVTPTAGYIITRVRLRAGISGAIVCTMAGALITLAPSLPIIILGLAMVSTGTFIAQTAAQSHLRVAAPAESRVDRCRRLPHLLLHRRHRRRSCSRSILGAG